jgi:TPR repeat protein
MYANGLGVLEDSVAAYAWWSIASTNGNSTARSNKDIFAKRMSREQIAEAQKLSRKLYDQIEARKAKKK